MKVLLQILIQSRHFCIDVIECWVNEFRLNLDWAGWEDFQDENI